MKKFQFSLQRVLEYRMTLEDQAKARFANVQRMINQTEQEIVDLGHEKRDMMDVR